jgi:predicted Fe-Mo cluster-binding NifX family protein
VVIDPESQQWQAYPNPGQQASGGAGIKAAQFIASLENVQAIVSGDFGPNAFEALEAAQIGMFLYDDCQTVAEALARFQAGALQAVTVPTQKGHHGQPS